MQTLRSILEATHWTGCLSKDQFEYALTETIERSVFTDDFIVRKGDPARYWYGVIEGLVKMSVASLDGRASTFTGISAGGWYGEGTLLKKERWRYDVIALKPTRLACLSLKAFEHLVSTSLPFNKYLLTHLNARLSLFIGLAEFDRLLGPDARVARCLASLFDPDLYPHRGNFVELSQEEIGLLSAVSRQRANRAIQALQSAGLLKVERGGVTVLDVNGLALFFDISERRLTVKRRGVPAASGTAVRRQGKGRLA